MIARFCGQDSRFSATGQRLQIFEAYLSEAAPRMNVPDFRRCYPCPLSHKSQDRDRDPADVSQANAKRNVDYHALTGMLAASWDDSLNTPMLRVSDAYKGDRLAFPAVGLGARPGRG